MRPSRRVLLPIFGALLLVGLAVLVWPRENEPAYQGRSLSDWLAVYEKAKASDASASDIQEGEKATNAVRAMGTNAVPILLQWMDHQLPSWRKRLLAAYYTHLTSNYRVYAVIVG